MSENNIRKLRKAAGLSQTDLAEAIGTTLNNFGKLERGSRRLNQTWINKIASALNVPPGSVIDEDLGPDHIPVVGYVGAGAQVYPYDDYARGDGMDFVERPEYIEGRAIAVEVKGSSMLPIAEDGWRLIYTGERTVVEAEVLNKLCVVQVREGPMLVKKVLRGSVPQRYHLHSSNAPLIEDAEIEWAARVRSIVPN